MMNDRHLVTCSVGLFALSIAGISTSSAGDEGASVSPTAAWTADSGDGDGAALPAGVSAEWWARAQTAIHTLENPNPAVPMPIPLRPRANWKAEGGQAVAY